MSHYTPVPTDPPKPQDNESADKQIDSMFRADGEVLVSVPVTVATNFGARHITKAQLRALITQERERASRERLYKKLEHFDRILLDDTASKENRLERLSRLVENEFAALTDTKDAA